MQVRVEDMEWVVWDEKSEVGGPLIYVLVEGEEVVRCGHTVSGLGARIGWYRSEEPSWVWDRVQYSRSFEKEAILDVEKAVIYACRPRYNVYESKAAKPRGRAVGAAAWMDRQKAAREVTCPTCGGTGKVRAKEEL